MFDWNDLHSFLELSRCGKLTLAGKRLKVQPTTIGRRITRLERELDVHLFDRSPKGYALTEEGRQLLPYTEKIESEINLVYQNLSKQEMTLTGSVRMAVPEGLGVGIISKYLKAFHKTHPGIELELLADTRAQSLSKREADIAIVMARPKSGRLIAWKLGDYRLALYGSCEYLTASKKIKAIDDLADHPFISYIDDLIDHPQLKYLQDIIQNPNIVFRSNSLQSQYQAVSDGMGLALLHGFLAAADKNLKPVLVKDIFIIREYWMVVHEDMRQLSRINAVCTFFSDVIKKEQKRLLTTG